MKTNNHLGELVTTVLPVGFWTFENETDDFFV